MSKEQAAPEGARVPAGWHDERQALLNFFGVTTDEFKANDVKTLLYWRARLVDFLQAVALPADSAKALRKHWCTNCLGVQPETCGLFNALTPLPSEPAAAEAVPGKKLWLWKNGDHFWAFDNLYPCFTPGGDPMTLGEPVGYAIFKPSHCRAGKEG